MHLYGLKAALYFINYGINGQIYRFPTNFINPDANSRYATSTICYREIFRITRPEQIVIVEGDNILNIINMLFMAEGYHSLLNLKAITKLKSRDGISQGGVGRDRGLLGVTLPQCLEKGRELFKK